MFPSESKKRSHTHTEKSKRYRTKKSQTHKKDTSFKHSKDSKYSRRTKLPKYFKHSKFKHINSVSNYVGPERLTKHIGLFTKGKISDSISRIERITSKEVKARAQQDLLEVLNLTSSMKNKLKKKSIRSVLSSNGSISPVQSLKSFSKSPAYLQNKTGFASSIWKDKLQKSVGTTAANSVLTSVHQLQDTSPIKTIQFSARSLLLKEIYPFVREINELLFPVTSHKDNLKNKLLYLKHHFLPPIVLSEKASSSSVNKSPQLSSKNKLLYVNHHPLPPTIITSKKASSSNGNKSPQLSSNNETNNSLNVLKEDFHLNPIFTGDELACDDISQLFPTAHELACGTDDVLVDNIVDHLIANTCVDNSVKYVNNGDLIADTNINDLFTDGVSVDLKKRIYDQEDFSSISSTCKRRKSSITLAQTSPETSDDSPVFKLQISPLKFVPYNEPTPTLYFRHKMF